MLAQQQRLQASAVDEQIARKRTVVPRLQRGDIAVVMRFDAGHVIEHEPHAKPFGAVLAQKHSELAGVEVVGVVRHCCDIRA